MGRRYLSRGRRGSVGSWLHFHFSRETDELRAVGNAKCGSSSVLVAFILGRGCERVLRVEENHFPTTFVMERLANIRGGCGPLYLAHP